MQPRHVVSLVGVLEAEPLPSRRVAFYSLRLTSTTSIESWCDLTSRLELWLASSLCPVQRRPTNRRLAEAGAVAPVRRAPARVTPRTPTPRSAPQAQAAVRRAPEMLARP